MGLSEAEYSFISDKPFFLPNLNQLKKIIFGLLMKYRNEPLSGDFN